ncbi:DUF423 domain-containing protein [Xanthobacter autotrophicus DSM 431]|uniref:DUF423 domain-containing protein n=1 Tax=Xanthobacter nonsaccharivorans TaxID=3119912 RepID=UPI00372BE240
MDLWTRLLLLASGLLGAAGVAAAAAAAHVTGGGLLETAAHFLLFTAVAVAGLCALALRLAGGSAVVRAGASLLVLGCLLFSGDLAARALMDVKLLGGSAPFGGTTMILGWLVVAASAFVVRKG